MNYLTWKEIEEAEDEGLRHVSLGSTPSDPKHPYHIQKKKLGSSFYLQQMIWYPVSSTGSLLLRTMDKAVSTWKAFRNFLPPDFKRILEDRLSKF
jgi:hypothetical protein